MLNNKILATKIFDIRQELGLTQAEFGKILGSSFQSVCAWEKGRNIPDLETIAKIIDMANITYDEFFSENAKVKEESDSKMYITPKEKRCIYKLRAMDTKTRQAFETILMSCK